MLNPTPTTIYLKDYRPPAFLISTVDLDVDIQDDCARVTASLAVRRNPKAADPKAPLVLSGDEVELESIALDGKPLPASAYSVDAAELTLANVPDQFTLTTVCRIHPRQNTKLMGLYASKDGYFTQCEAEGFRRITFFLDRPDVMARYTTIHADKQKFPVLLSNGTGWGAAMAGHAGWTRSPSPPISSPWWPPSSTSSRIATSRSRGAR
jgi:aminopeptidase N